VADGISPGLDRARLRALGNAVVPAVAEWIGRRVTEAAGLAASPGEGSVGFRAGASVLRGVPSTDPDHPASLNPDEGAAA
jgi:2,3-bisphosphoglycerate-independent phosphoglycerate mutase